MQFTAELTAVKCQFSDEKCCNIFLIFVLNLDFGKKIKLQLARVPMGTHILVWEQKKNTSKIVSPLLISVLLRKSEMRGVLENLSM